VSWVSPDRTVRGTATTVDLDTVTTGATTPWTSTPGAYRLGSGVGIAVLDTGVNPNRADWNSPYTGLSRLTAWKDLVGGQLTPYDDNGHGTHVAGSPWASAPGGSTARLRTRA